MEKSARFGACGYVDPVVAPATSYDINGFIDNFMDKRAHHTTSPYRSNSSARSIRTLRKDIQLMTRRNGERVRLKQDRYVGFISDVLILSFEYID